MCQVVELVQLSAAVLLWSLRNTRQPSAKQCSDLLFQHVIPGKEFERFGSLPLFNSVRKRTGSFWRTFTI